MKKYLLLSLLALVLLLPFFGLTSKTVYAYDGETYSKRIVVSGSASVYNQPNIATAIVGVETVNQDVSAAEKENSEKMSEIISTLKGMGINETDIKTNQFSIFKKYNYANGTQKLEGYQITNTVSFKTQDILTLGNILTSLTKVGANIFNGVTLNIQDTTQAYNQALNAALQNAYEKLNSLVNNAQDYTIKQIIEEGNNYSSPYYLDSALLKSSQQNSIPIMGGEILTTAKIKVIFELN